VYQTLQFSSAEELFPGFNDSRLLTARESISDAPAQETTKDQFLAKADDIEDETFLRFILLIDMSDCQRFVP
jgi:hypothetical protein